MNFKIEPINSDFFKNYDRIGELSYFVNNVSNLDSITPESLVFCTYLDPEKVSSIKAGILLVNDSLQNKLSGFKSQCIVFCESPKFLFLKTIEKLFDDSFTDDLHDEIDPTIKVSKRSYVERGAKIGQHSVIFPNTSIFKCVTVGARSIIQAGSVIGGNGLGDVEHNNKFHRFVHLGGVEIGEDVNIGCNVTVLRGMLENTVIGKGTRIANNVNVGHNVVLEENCYVSAGVTIGGASLIKKGSWLAPGVCLADHVTVGENTIIGTGSLLVKDALPNSVYYGSPAKRIRER